MQMRERALSHFANPAWGATRINNIGITHGFLLRYVTMARVSACYDY